MIASPILFANLLTSFDFSSGSNVASPSLICLSASTLAIALMLKELNSVSMACLGLGVDHLETLFEPMTRQIKR